MTKTAVSFSETGEGLRCAARVGQLIQAAQSTKDDRAARPREADPWGEWGSWRQRDGCAAGNGDLLYFSSCLEAQPLTVRRKGQLPRILGAGHR